MIEVFCDGLCEPVNPGGTACYGWVVYRDRERIACGSGVVCSGPNATNNVAEYSAVISALEYLLENGINENVVVKSDSQLVIYQLSGAYAVRSPRVRPLYEKAKKLAGQFAGIRYQWVPREQNKEADALSRLAYHRDRAESLAPTVMPAGNGLYAVASQSQPGKTYLVDRRRFACECPAFRKEKVCKHILAVMLREGGKYECS